MAGCASGKGGLVLETVGPARAPTATPDDSRGALVVYSAYEVNADFNSPDRYRPEYSDYKIFTPDGKLLQRVHNNSGTILQDPATVPLPEGKYRVVALANGYGFVTVPVKIKAGQNTIVHLEGGGSRNPSVPPTDAVQLPDGQIVGSKSSG